jgi:hypothetical protein
MTSIRESDIRSLGAHRHDGRALQSPRAGDFSKQEASGIIVLSEDHWIFSGWQSNSYETLDHGATWGSPLGLGGTSALTLENGDTLWATLQGVERSPGNGNWEVLEGSAWGSYGLVRDGDSLWGARRDLNPNPALYWRGSISTGTWTNIPEPPVEAGAVALAIDAEHHLLYSANEVGGLWRQRYE